MKRLLWITSFALLTFSAALLSPAALATEIKITTANGELPPSNGAAKDIKLAELTKSSSFKIKCTLVNPNKKQVEFRADITPAAVVYQLDDKGFHLQTMVKPGTHSLALNVAVKESKLTNEPLLFSITNFGNQTLKLSNCTLVEQTGTTE